MMTAPLLAHIDVRRYERIVVLSPHLDDAALSCGALLLSLPDDVRRLVVTVSAGDPEPSGGSQWRSRTDPAARRREDERAMDALRCPFVHLGFRDAIDRRGADGRLLYRREAALWQPPGPEHDAYRAELRIVLERLCRGAGPTLVVAPLGVGGHVDHRLCAEAALALQGPDVELLAYEDFPYAAAPDRHGVGGDDSAAALVRLGVEGVQRFACPVDADAKLEVLAHYASQIDQLFSDREGLRRLVESQTWDDTPCEHYWSIRRRHP